MSANANQPQPLGTDTAASTLSSTEATYLPPSDLAAKYHKGIQAHEPATPHTSLTAGGGGDGKQNPHLIKSVESFYVRPRWLFVRIETEGGVVGWGEATLEGHTEAVQGSLKDIARR
jgi:galactonate dehydratase